MNTDLIPFSFESSSIRFITHEDGSWSVVAKDVAEALGYIWQPAVIKHIPDEWKGITRNNTLGGSQDMLTLTEQGLYFFLGRSDKPKALPFQKWTAGEVLPSIRKTGGYRVGAPEPVAFPVARQIEIPRTASLSLETLQALQQVKTDLKITDDFSPPQRPNQPRPANYVALLGAVLDDILAWRYPYSFAYGFDLAGKGYLMIRLSDLIYHLRTATHFKEFFSRMSGKAQWRIEQDLSVRGLLCKVKRGPVVDDVRLSYRLDLVNFQALRCSMEATD
ncbi:MAG: hypothetical protein H6974_11120 [Gammaproteobacteria bacterium]|nr:hypothetical protein [Gammaproteobacteria bacterium]